MRVRRRSARVRHHGHAMLRTSWRQHRALAVAGAVGVWGLSAYPFVHDNPFLGLIDAAGAARVRAAALRLRHAVVHDAVPGGVVARVAGGDRRVPARAAARSSRRCHRTRSRNRARRPRWCWAKPTSKPRPAARRRRSGSRFPSAGSTRASWCWAPWAPARRPRACIPTWTSCCAGAAPIPTARSAGLVLEVKGDFCGQVRGHAAARGTRVRLRRDRARLRHLLQPAAQRPRSLRRGLRHRHAAEQPVRQVEGAVLAAGVHRPAEVRDPAAAHHRRLHHVLGGVPLRAGRRADRPRHPPPQGGTRESTHRPAHPEGRPSGALHAGAVAALAHRRRRPCGASVRGRPRGLPGGAPRRLRGAEGAGHGVDRPQAAARGRRALVRARLEQAGCAPPVVDRRRRGRVPVAVRRQPRGASHLLSAPQCLHRGARRRASPGPCRRSARCSRAATCWRSTSRWA